jgi:hypothetical protein
MHLKAGYGRHELSNQPLVDAAYDFTARGWPVIPLSGKQPTIAWKEFQNRVPSGGELDEWFHADDIRPTGIGIVTGRVSRLVVVDCDTADDAAWWQSQYDGSPWTARTGGGGLHLYYAMPQGSEVRNRAHIEGRKIDVRGEGGYVTAPPSLHPGGTRYEWLICDASVDLPLFQEEWISPSSKICGGFNSVPQIPEVRNAAVYISRIQAVSGEGGHNATFRAACKLRDAGLSRDEALLILSGWNQTNASPPWSARELEHKIESAFKLLAQ